MCNEEKHLFVPYLVISFQVIDGFNFLDSHKRKVYSLPDDASDQKRQLDLCRTRQSEQPKVVELSQNAGQISYNLAKSNSILVNVEFIPVEPSITVPRVRYNLDLFIFYRI